MIEINNKDNEVDITIKYYQTIGGKPKIELIGTADLSHHLIEGVFSIIDKLARMENCSHQSKEWKND